MLSFSPHGGVYQNKFWLLWSWHLFRSCIRPRWWLWSHRLQISSGHAIQLEQALHTLTVSIQSRSQWSKQNLQAQSYPTVSRKTRKWRREKNPKLHQPQLMGKTKDVQKNEPITRLADYSSINVHLLNDCYIMPMMGHFDKKLPPKIPTTLYPQSEKQTSPLTLVPEHGPSRP